jgi:DNA-binding XRE family transcriptional regulator
MERLIYGLRCPVTKRIHYIGKSTQGMRRPLQHLSDSHSAKIREWVNDLAELNYKPEIVIIQEVIESEDIDMAERVWISRYIDRGATLLNESLVITAAIRPDLDDLISSDHSSDYRAVGRFVSERRRAAGLTQVQFAEKTGIALTVVRKIEQGKTNINLNGLLEVLSMFNHTITIKKINC